MIFDKPEDTIKKLRRERLEKLERCFQELKSYEFNKLKFQYPTFFVPGWTSEDCSAWKEPYNTISKKYKTYYRPIHQWVDEIIEDKGNAFYITFTEDESANSLDFIQLGRCLKKKIINVVGDSPVNLVGHSMGGLDIRAAILDDDEPKIRVKNVITVGTPNNGTGEAGLFIISFIKRLVQRIKKFKPHHIAQGISMFSKGEPIKMINSIANRIKMLNSLDIFYVFMGLKDAVVKGSPKLRKEGVPEELCHKIKTIQTSSADHSGKDGITQDPRVILPILKILCGIEIKDDYNYGYIYRKT